MNNSLTALEGVTVGHATHPDKLTGCTVVKFDGSFPVGFKTYGGDPATFGTESITNGKTHHKMDGLFVAGGSLNGLMSASEIMQAMIDARHGLKVESIVNPFIAGAIVFDLGVTVGQYDPKYGAEAYHNASSDPVTSGNVGAGTGTSVGKYQHLERGSVSGAMKAGVGSARVDVGGGAIVVAMSVVNALGNVVNPDGTILAGNRDETKPFKAFEDTVNFVTQQPSNTTISIVGTNVPLGGREAYEKLAHYGSHGQVRAIDPIHTSVDGDTVFAFSTEKLPSFTNDMAQYFQTSAWPQFEFDVIGHAAAKAVQQSIYDACHQAETIHYTRGYQGIIPSVKDYPKE